MENCIMNEVFVDLNIKPLNCPCGVCLNCLEVKNKNNNEKIDLSISGTVIDMIDCLGKLRERGITLDQLPLELQEIRGRLYSLSDKLINDRQGIKSDEKKLKKLKNMFLY